MGAEPRASLSAEQIAAMFGVHPAGSRVIASGSDRRNHALALPGGGRAFLRVYPRGDTTSAPFEVHLAEHLSSRGVPTPVPLPLARPGAGRIAAHDGCHAVLLPWIEGEIVRARAIDARHARRAGAALARLHLAGASFPDPPDGRFGPAQLARRLAPHARASEPARAIAARLDAWQTEGQLAETGLVHGDLFRDNLLWCDHEISAVLDLETASRGSLACDLMITVLAWCFGDSLDLDRARSLVSAYSEVRPLTPVDRRDLHRAARLAALRFAITRLVFFGEEPRAAYHRDFRRFIARLDAVEQIGEAAWPSALGL